MVKLGSFREGLATDHGHMAHYEDPYDGAAIFVTEEITGYRVMPPKSEPGEPQATVIPIHPTKQ